MKIAEWELLILKNGEREYGVCRSAFFKGHDTVDEWIGDNDVDNLFGMIWIVIGFWETLFHDSLQFIFVFMWLTYIIVVSTSL